MTSPFFSLAEVYRDFFNPLSATMLILYFNLKNAKCHIISILKLNKRTTREHFQQVDKETIASRASTNGNTGDG